jgi:hypothetical protein
VVYYRTGLLRHWTASLSYSPRSAGTSTGYRRKGLSPLSNDRYCDTVMCNHLTTDRVKLHHLTTAIERQMVEPTNLGLQLRRNTFCKSIMSGVKSGVKVDINLLELA